MADTKTYTTNYNLEKPGQDDFYDVAVFNANANKIDTELKAAADRDAAHKNAPVLDHAAGSVTDAHIGNRTITDTVTAAVGANTITTLFNMVGNMLKRITGKTTWWTPPATTLEAANSHITAATGAHGATNANTANAIVQRDASGNFIAGTITAALNGLAATATKLATARTIAISGKVTGTATGFDGSGNITIPVTSVTADSCTGNSATATTAATATKLATARSISLTGDVTGTTNFDGSGNVSIATTNTAAMPVGFTFPLLANSPLPGSLALQGALVSRTAYPDLWAWVQANAPLITESAWQAQAAAQSSVGAYSSGDGSTNFRLPKIVDFVRGSDANRAPGAWQADDFKSHNHFIQQNFGYRDSGTVQSVAVGNTAQSATGNMYTADTGGTETRPKSISMLWCVKAFGAATNQGVVDITALAVDVTGISSNKLNKADYHTKAWVNFNGVGTVAIRASYNVSSITDNGVGDYTVNLTTALADTNGAVLATAGRFNDGNLSPMQGPAAQMTTTSAINVKTGSNTNALSDATDIYVAVFR